MRRNPKKGGQFAIIWVDLLYEDSVPATAKILFGEIYRLSGPDGWCDASNQDFMDLLGCSETTVRNLLKALEDVGQIRVVTQPRREGTGGTERRIFCGRKLAPPEVPEVPAKNCGYPGEGTRRKLRGVPAEICGSTYSSNNYNNTPLYPPKGDPGGSKKKKRGGLETAPEVWAAAQAYAGEDPELLAAMTDFLRCRELRKKPMLTVRSFNTLTAKLGRMAPDRAMKVMLLDYATSNNWNSVYPMKEDELPGKAAGAEDQQPEDQEGIDGI